MRDFTVKENDFRIHGIFGDLVLRDLVCCVRLTGEDVPAEGAVTDLIAALKEEQLVLRCVLSALCRASRRPADPCVR